MPSQGYCISGKEIEVHGSGSPRFSSVIRAWLAGLPWFPTPSAVLLVSLVNNPKPRGTFSWPTSESPFTPFLPAASLLHSSKLLRESSSLLLHLAFRLPKLHGKGSPNAASFPPFLQSCVVPLQHGCHAWVSIPVPIFFCIPFSDSSHNQLHLPALSYFSSFSWLL